MKIKRLTFTKKFWKFIAVLVPLYILYFWTPTSIVEEGKFLFMGLTIISWEFGVFIGKVLTDEP